VEFSPFLRRAKGSLVEVETQLSLSADLEFSAQHEVDGLLKQTQILGKKILNLERSLERHHNNWSGCGRRPRSLPPRRDYSLFAADAVLNRSVTFHRATASAFQFTDAGRLLAMRQTRGICFCPRPAGSTCR
jgi:hypothetical protein